jgi:DNA invertase Pin-like site-specific DNA recombinase
MADRPVRKLRCAVYTRKSSDEGLEQDFNSLHAQREACEAYILSQRHEGWQVLPATYDDGGFSGGSMERPALQRLLADIALGKVDVVVVYKVDRLTRSLADFAKIVEVFDGKGASFVSVTQQFNTTSSMGRLTLNVLLSFAQFEREVTGERIRDKIAASKAKGMWMGGLVPIGYDRKDRTLTINAAEAETVRTIFREYLRVGSMGLLTEAISARGLRTKTYVTGSGRTTGGHAFRRGHLHFMLTNPLYIGEIVHKGRRHPGMHPGIIDRETWEAVQTRLASKATRARGGSNVRSQSLLTGMIFTADGKRLSPSYSSKGGRRYPYYIDKSPSEGSSPLRLPAAQTDAAVIRVVSSFLRDRERLTAEFAGVVRSQQLAALLDRAAELANRLEDRNEARSLLQQAAARVEISDHMVGVALNRDAFVGGSQADLKVSTSEDSRPILVAEHFQFERQGVDVRMILGEDAGGGQPDFALIKAIARGNVWFDDLTSGRAASIAEIAGREGVTGRYVSQQISLAFLSPSLVALALDGKRPFGIGAKELSQDVDLPLLWEAQEQRLGRLRKGD